MTVSAPLTRCNARIDQSATFTDRFGNQHGLISGYRSKIKPGWESMLEPEPRTQTEQEIRRRLDEVDQRVHLGIHMLSMFECPVAGKDVLVIGCDQGEEVAYLAAAGAASVTGTNYDGDGSDSHWTIDDRPTALDQASPVHPILMDHIDQVGGYQVFRQATTRIVTDDIESSQFPDASFDIICSWRTLEHLTDAPTAFRQMARLLRPGGIAFHEYNPFFCIDGGHSPVTLDFPWGHVCLDAADLERYLNTFRPDEKDFALQFYHSHLNRMSIAQMELDARAVGFEVEALIPRTRTEDLLEVTSDILRAARRNYPYVSLNDLICRVVRVVLRCP